MFGAGPIVGGRRRAGERRRVAHSRARRRPQGLDAARRPRRSSPAALAVAEREHADGRGVPAGGGAWLRGRAAHRRGGQSEPLSLLASHRHRGDVRRGRGGGLAARPRRRRRCSTRSARAGTQAAGLWEFNADGAMSKHLHPGKAAFNGVLAADLARAGFTGATRILEGERGFFRATTRVARRQRASPTGSGDGGRSARTATSCTRAAATRTRRSTSRSISARSAAGSATRRATSRDRHRDVRAGLRDRERAESRARRTRRSSASRTASAAALREGRVGSSSSRPTASASAAWCDPRSPRCSPRTHVTVARRSHGEVSGRVAGARARSRSTTARRCAARATIPRGNPENPVTTDDARGEVHRARRAALGRARRAARARDRADRSTTCADMRDAVRGAVLIARQR